MIMIDGSCQQSVSEHRVAVLCTPERTKTLTYITLVRTFYNTVRTFYIHESHYHASSIAFRQVEMLFACSSMPDNMEKLA